MEVVKSSSKLFTQLKSSLRQLFLPNHFQCSDGNCATQRIPSISASMFILRMFMGDGGSLNLVCAPVWDVNCLYLILALDYGREHNSTNVGIEQGELQQTTMPIWLRPWCKYCLSCYYIWSEPCLFLHHKLNPKLQQLRAKKSKHINITFGKSPILVFSLQGKTGEDKQYSPFWTVIS